jgi:hypothetical protein
MNKPTILKTERVDDIPLLLAQLERMGVQELLDQHFPTHGNWQGLSLGQVAIVWLSHISDGSLIFREGDEIANGTMRVVAFHEFVD